MSNVYDDYIIDKSNPILKECAKLRDQNKKLKNDLHVAKRVIGYYANPLIQKDGGKLARKTIDELNKNQGLQNNLDQLT